MTRTFFSLAAALITSALCLAPAVSADLGVTVPAHQRA